MNQDKQTLATKRGEILFRRQLAQQQLGVGEIIIPEAHTRDEILEIMRNRATVTRDMMRRLQEKNIEFSPFLEIGSERCQRALVMTNEFDAEGIALDISFEMLKYADVVAQHLGYERMPIRVCADAYNLPFQDCRFFFAFCYQTLHHFPDPRPICKEIARVLRHNGVFFLDEEPIRGIVRQFTQIYHRKGYHLNRLEKILAKLKLLGLFVEGGNLEREYGILEKSFSLKEWQRILVDFEPVEMGFIVGSQLGSRFNIPAPMANFLGGAIRAICHVHKQRHAPPAINLLEAFGCPNCVDRHPLQTAENEQGLLCTQCGTFYPELDGVLFLFERSQGRSLYPHILS